MSPEGWRCGSAGRLGDPDGRVVRAVCPGKSGILSSKTNGGRPLEGPRINSLAANQQRLSPCIPLLSARSLLRALHLLAGAPQSKFAVAPRGK